MKRTTSPDSARRRHATGAGKKPGTHKRAQRPLEHPLQADEPDHAIRQAGRRAIDEVGQFSDDTSDDIPPFGNTEEDDEDDNGQMS